MHHLDPTSKKDEEADLGLAGKNLRTSATAKAFLILHHLFGWPILTLKTTTVSTSLLVRKTLLFNAFEALGTELKPYCHRIRIATHDVVKNFVRESDLKSFLSMLIRMRMCCSLGTVLMVMLRPSSKSIQANNVSNIVIQARLWSAHHGGAGIMACGLLNACPTSIIQFLEDQPFWDDVVAAADTGPRPVPHASLTEKSFTVIIETLLDPNIERSAKDIAAICDAGRL
ncbi:glycosyltransferase family 1 protein [Bipolaris oryzae ATCC 44560]|uniref:Glycosyltransferase family 1 protein n=1 Tax=Bipolaris oryzae ATCC 44560 TaxID=930090 RepID=W6YXC7_COCMI|nr:glycosyltransferase family 1 protein [Bipolaris oryzae ATCC 44560]EUC40184.1 glycosyltransferase family 1 protein [Bipolaris oryzae ATCC 44560]